MAESLQISGSESMRPMVAACAEDFMQTFPQTDVIVKGGGTGSGISALLSGLTELGMASRPLSANETSHVEGRHIRISHTALARDAIALIVHPDNPLADLSLPELAAIYTGQIETWLPLKGSDAPITVLGRVKGSGTADFFDTAVVSGGQEIAAEQRMTNEDIVAEVAGNPGAIGYTGLGALRNAGDSVRVLAIRPTADAAAIFPDPAAVSAGTYPLGRTLWLIATLPQAPLALAFVDHCTGPDGRMLLQNFGYIDPAPANSDQTEPDEAAP